MLSALGIIVLTLVIADQALGATVEQGKKVKIHYTLRVDGEVVDSSDGLEPLEYVHGEDKILPEALQKGLEGLAIGEKRQITLQPEEGYGPVRSDAIMEVPLASLPAEGVAIGTVLTTTMENNQVVRATVKELGAEAATLDFNHPLAGKILNFDVEIVAIA